MSHRGRVGLLVNPTAGRGDGRAAGTRVLQTLRSLGHEVTDLSGPDPAAVARDARERAGQFQALVVVGGDGIVHAGVEAVAGTGTALGIVPAGTGNDIARGLDLPLGDPVGAAESVARALHAGRYRDVDAVRVTHAAGTGWYASILASGVDALVNERANSWRWPHGPARYTLAALRELAVVRGVGVRVDLDLGDRRESFERDCLLVAVANTRCYGGGMLMAPQADPADGRLDVVVVDALPPLRALTLLPTVRRGRHLDVPAVHVHRARSVTLTHVGDGPRPRPHADGEPLGDLPVTCEVVPGALRVLT
ncbi:diacylglycerol/lipid kinase family protein [Kineococcus sp. SYSU DK002]|uniref:diacylglycerol/lipid kinase family protein n=1 Tax=Kineococcus sp. SYSU DK002 TaxID=3383123 RepID=UPI003D7DCA8F